MNALDVAAVLRHCAHDYEQECVMLEELVPHSDAHVAAQMKQSACTEAVRKLCRAEERRERASESRRSASEAAVKHAAFMRGEHNKAIADSQAVAESLSPELVTCPGSGPAVH